MSTPPSVGITGGIGSGKSLVCAIFKTLGIPVYDADSSARQLMTSDAVLVKQIIDRFGEQSYSREGALNREYLSAKVFNDPAQLEILNQLVHPRVAIDHANWTERNKEAVYLVKEAALLYESGSYKSLDKIIVVAAPEPLRVKRVLGRDKSRKEEDVWKIIRNQMAEEEKVKRADFVIRNDETELVVPQVLKLHERFIASARH